MKIYTRTGDNGTTSLFSGGRVRKNHIRVQAYGEVDEANSAIGLAIALLNDREKLVQEFLNKMQHRLFDLGAELSTANPEALTKLPRLTSDADIDELEAEIDRLHAGLPPLKNFILPGGTPAAAQVQLSRAILRRAERTAAAIENLRPEVLRYLNRASDFLFVLGRYLNYLSGVSETEWQK